MGVWCGGVEGDEDNIPDERVVCHPPARAPNPPARARRGTKTWNMNFWPLTLSKTTMMRMRMRMIAELIFGGTAGTGGRVKFLLGA